MHCNLNGVTNGKTDKLRTTSLVYMGLMVVMVIYIYVEGQPRQAESGSSKLSPSVIALSTSTRSDICEFFFSF